MGMGTKILVELDGDLQGLNLKVKGGRLLLVQGPLGWYAELTIDAFFEWLQLIALITLNGFIDQPFFLCQGKVCKE